MGWGASMYEASSAESRREVLVLVLVASTKKSLLSTLRKASLTCGLFMILASANFSTISRLVAPWHLQAPKDILKGLALVLLMVRMLLKELLDERKNFELLYAGGMLYEKGAIGSGKNANAKTRNGFGIGKTLIGS
eukprot:751038_1